MKDKDVRNQSKKLASASKKSSVSVVDREASKERRSTVESVLRAFAKDDDWKRAQDYIEQANQVTGKKRAKYAKEALASCDMCVEAYVLLAQDSTTLDDAINTFRQGTKAGEKMIAHFARDLETKHYWDVPEIQSYLMVLQALANCLELSGDFDGAIDLYEQLLTLNPEDHQAARFSLAPCLLQAERYDDLEQRLKECKDEPSAWIGFTKALYLFKTAGPSKKAITALDQAIERNPFVLQYMAGLVELPDGEPEMVELGGESEAQAYVMQYGHQWQSTTGALDWIGDTLAKSIDKVMNDPNTRDIAIQKLLEGLVIEDVMDDSEDEDDEPGTSSKSKPKPKKKKSAGSTSKKTRK